MDVYFESDNTICINKGKSKECFSKVTDNKVHFDCDGANASVEMNTEKIDYILNVLNEMPGPRQGALTLRYS